MTVNPALAIDFAQRHPAAAARVIERLPAEDATRFFAGLSAARAAPILAEMPIALAASIIGGMNHEHAAAIARAMPFQTVLRILRLLSPAARAALLEALPAARAIQFGHALQLPPGSVGAWTDGSQPAFAAQRPVSECLDILRSSRARAPEAVYVVDDERKPVGELHLIDLIRAPRSAQIGDLNMTEPETIPATMPIANAALDARWQRRAVLAVTARSGELTGGFTHRDLARALASTAGGHHHPRSQEPVWTGLIGAYLIAVEGLSQTLFSATVADPDA